MVGRRRGGQLRTRNRRQIRAQMRQIHRAISLEPRRITCPADPPPVNHSFHHNTIIPVYLGWGTTAGFSPGTGDTDPTITFAYDTTKKVVAPYSLQVTQLYAAWRQWTGHSTEASAWYHGDVSVSKICYWGPSATELTTIAIGLAVDLPAPGSSASVTDVGTTTRRAHCSLTMPQLWTAASQDFKIICVDCDNEGTLARNENLRKTLDNYPQLGCLHVTLSVKLTKAT